LIRIKLEIDRLMPIELDIDRFMSIELAMDGLMGLGAGNLPEKALWFTAERKAGRATLVEAEPMREATLGANMRAAAIVCEGGDVLEEECVCVGSKGLEDRKDERRECV
jgi:hypothetical protein